MLKEEDISWCSTSQLPCQAITRKSLSICWFSKGSWQIMVFQTASVLKGGNNFWADGDMHINGMFYALIEGKSEIRLSVLKYRLRKMMHHCILIGFAE